MSKQNKFVKFLIKINLLINSLLKKNLNKLNTSNFLNKKTSIISANRVFLCFVALTILFLSYLSIPHIFNRDEIKQELKNQLSQRFTLNFVFSDQLEYKFLPRPHFIFRDVSILEDEFKVSDIKSLKVFVSLNNLFSLNDINIKNINIDNANFNLNKKNYDFFIKILNNNFLNSIINIKDSNIFYQISDKEVLFINKINSMKFSFDPKSLKNVIYSENELFNFPFIFKAQNDLKKKIFYSNINLKILKLNIDSIFNYSNKKKTGLLNFLYNKNKSKLEYSVYKDFFKFNLTDKSIETKFSHNGEVNLEPFFLDTNGDVDSLNLKKLLNSNSVLVQLFKTQILNNKNINLTTTLTAKNIIPTQMFTNSNIIFKIQEGVIDIDETKFQWINCADFQITDSLLNVNENNLILSGKLTVDVNDPSKIYQFLQTAKKHRIDMKKIELYFMYNFDQQAVTINNLKVNEVINLDLEKGLNNFSLMKNQVQNKIYFKNLINKILKNYSG